MELVDLIHHNLLKDWSLNGIIVKSLKILVPACIYLVNREQGNNSLKQASASSNRLLKAR